MMTSVGFVDARIPFVSFGSLIPCDEGRQCERILDDDDDGCGIEVHIKWSRIKVDNSNKRHFNESNDWGKIVAQQPHSDHDGYIWQRSMSENEKKSLFELRFLFDSDCCAVLNPSAEWWTVWGFIFIFCFLLLIYLFIVHTVVRSLFNFHVDRFPFWDRIQRDSKWFQACFFFFYSIQFTWIRFSREKYGSKEHVCIHIYNWVYSIV